MTITPQISAALWRGLGLALLTTIGTAGTYLMMPGVDVKYAIGGALVTFALSMGWRMGEGVFDSQRQASGDVRPADVGAVPIPTTPPQ